MPPGNLKLFLTLETCEEHETEVYCILWEFSRAHEYFILKQNVLTISHFISVSLDTEDFSLDLFI